MEGALGEHCSTRSGLISEPPPTPERSALMARVNQKNTSPEMKVRRFLHGRGYRFRLHDRSLPGSPDLVLPSRRIAVFIHGCFWHRHGCKATTTPKTRTGFWTEKFEVNQVRDARNEQALIAVGWQPITIWECDIKADRFHETLLMKLEATPPVGRRPRITVRDSSKRQQSLSPVMNQNGRFRS